MTAKRSAYATGRDVRAACRAGGFTGPTSAVTPGFVQANLVILTADDAKAFELFCTRNPRPCPLLETLPVGCYEPKSTAPEADLRTDLPGYRLYKQGVLVSQPRHLLDLWQDDLVAFLLGCSFTFDRVLRDAGVPVRHVEAGTNVPMYRTNLACSSAGPFHGPLVVSMRPMTLAQADLATTITSTMPLAHGAPVQIGEPEKLGIANLDRPDYGDAVHLFSGEVPVFWACGVTPLEAITRAKPAIAMTHEPGHMFVTDWPEKILRQ